MNTLAMVHAEFHRRLSHVGQVVIAGGAVRDAMRGVAPKDYDVFVLGAGDAASEPIVTALGGLEVVSPLDWHKSEPFLQGTFHFADAVVQVMASPHPSIEALADSFDWNVSRFVYDGQCHDYGVLADIAPGKSLRLHKVNFPLSTLRRGFRFSERFAMVFEKDDIVSLCKTISQQAEMKAEAAHAAH